MTLPTIDPGFSTDVMTALFGAGTRVAMMCRVEAALARASADVGILGDDVAGRIATACGEGVEDPEAVLVEGWVAGTPVLPLLDRLRDRLDDEAARWLHHGATTQDVVDTGLVLQVSDALEVLGDDLAALVGRLRDLAVAQRTTPTTGWTFLQPAVPTTVGRRVAGWLAPVVEALAAVRAARRGLRVQLGGPTGTLDVLGEDGPAVHDRMAELLGLVAPPAPWHADRSPVHDVVAVLSRLTRTVATIGTDLALLARDGTARMRAGGSSSMPDKRNPIDAIRAVAAAEACAGVAATVLHGRAIELERGVGGWHAETFAVPLVVQTAGAAVEALSAAVASLELDGDLPDADVAPGAVAFTDRVVAACDAALGGSAGGGSTAGAEEPAR